MVCSVHEHTLFFRAVSAYAIDACVFVISAGVFSLKLAE
mgnify:CR=1 FL=1